MTKARFILLMTGALLALASLFSSCIEDGFTTSSSDVLAFDKDTVAFDTVITLQGTATKQMVVYNHSKKQVNISSIKVAGEASKGHFHLNVDGIRGDEFQNVEIRGNDSIYRRRRCCLVPGDRTLSVSTVILYRAICVSRQINRI